MTICAVVYQRWASGGASTASADGDGMSAVATTEDPAERAFADFLVRYWPEALRFFRQNLYRDRDRQQAEDCAQETFLKLARRYRDDTATVRAVGDHQQRYGRPMTVAALAVALGCTVAVAESRARRCVESAWLHVTETATGPRFGCTLTPGPVPHVLDLAPLAAMRWTTYRNVLADYGRRAQTRLAPLTDTLDDLLAVGAEPRDGHPGPATTALTNELHAMVAACLDLLARAERTVLILYYFYGLRFPAIAEIAGIPALVASPDAAETRSAAQLVQRLKDLAKAGRRQMRRQCPQLADFPHGWRVTTMDDTPLYGIDYCDHLLTASQTGQLTPWATIRACPICLRRWWIAEARLHGWGPLPRAAVLPLFEQLASALLAGETAGDQVAQGFYAYLATTPAAEADFAIAVAAARQSDEEQGSPPGDFGWRALFADPAPMVPTTEARQITRVWQWRTAGTTIAGAGRTFVHGETPPPFVPTPPDTSRARGWIREGGSDAQPPLQRQIVGPLLLTLTAGDRADELHLTLRLRENAGETAASVRIYLGGATEEDSPPPLAWTGILSEAQRTVIVTRPRADLHQLTIELDTAW